MITTDTCTAVQTVAVLVVPVGSSINNSIYLGQIRVAEIKHLNALQQSIVRCWQKSRPAEPHLPFNLTQRWPLPLRGQGGWVGPCPWAERWLREHPIVARVRRASYYSDDLMSGETVKTVSNAAQHGSTCNIIWILWIDPRYKIPRIIPISTWDKVQDPGTRYQVLQYKSYRIPNVSSREPTTRSLSLHITNYERNGASQTNTGIGERFFSLGIFLYFTSTQTGSIR